MLRQFLYTFLLLLMCFGTCHARKQKLKVVSFNIKVEDKADGDNQWKNRKPLVMKFLSKEKPDIICMQEVLRSQLNDIKVCFPEYEMVGAPRVDGKTRGDYIPIFYKKDKFGHIDSGTFWLSETQNKAGSIGWDAKYPRTATWINLRVIKTGEILFVLNTHLDNAGKEARVKGMNLILENIPILSKSDSIILTGDFNDIVSSKVYQTVSQGRLNDTYVVSRKKKGVPYTFHQFGQKEMGRRYKLDYIFTSDHFKIQSVNIPKEKAKRNVFLSDHNPVIVKMKY